MRVRMIPTVEDFATEESGIKRVVEAYEKYSSQYGIQYVGKGEACDLYAIHAGIRVDIDPTKPLVAHLHGLYWTNDYLSDGWEWRTNAKVIYTARCATKITVPSEWVAESFQRDMHIDPTVIYHGIDWKMWEHSHEHTGIVIWNKNRAGVDVVDPMDFITLGSRFKDIQFVTTFSLPSATANVKAIGLQDHAEMKKIVQQAEVYVSISKETFGIGALEALASGTPVLGYAWGGNLITVEHGVNGYLAKPGDIDDLSEGLKYCIKYRDVLSANAKVTARKFSWEKPMQKLAGVYQEAIDIFNDKKRPHIRSISR